MKLDVDLVWVFYMISWFTWVCVFPCAYGGVCSFVCDLSVF